MTRRGFFSSIAAAAIAGIAIPRELIVASERAPCLVQPRDHLQEYVDSHAFMMPPFMFHPVAFVLAWGDDQETGIHVRAMETPEQRLEIHATFVEEMTRAEFARRYPPAVGRVRFLEVDV